jgi:hypothetical protein
MTESVPVAELIGEHRHSGRHTARVLCPNPGCGRTHQHFWPTDPTITVTAPCGAVYTIGIE